MFNKIHKIGVEPKADEYLVFAGSKYVKAFPCGRRRAYYADETPVPFDPEAKLNTEFNNRKITGTGGYAQSFYCGHNWSSDALKCVIDGYYFEIALSDNYNKLQDFCNSIITKMCAAALDKPENNITDEERDRYLNKTKSLYANIKLAKVQLYESTEEALDSYTWVLKNQSKDDDISWLDLSITEDPDDVDDFYFSGLSFSICPVANTAADATETVLYNMDSTQQDFSLKLFIFRNNAWELNLHALLPEIAHGDSEKAIKVAELQTEKAVIIDDEGEKTSVPALKVQYLGSSGDVRKYQLQFTNTDIITSIQKD